ncbi:MAG TPA: hypothetical protein VML50_05890 [Anaeromyxobacter sp.]|nr:hypothetical protein [Anaeromyxobacter sp.]
MRAAHLTIAASAALAFARPALAQCTPGTSWTRSWTDAYGETTYSLTAPCKVNLGVPFDITATVTDAAYPNDTVGYDWAILDNGAVIGGSTTQLSWITTAGGQWQTVLTVTYTVLATNHTLQLEFTDLGEGSGAHGFAGSVIGALTVDPYPPVAAVGPDLTLATKDLPGTVIAGTASDPDGDPLTFRWLEGATALQDWRPVGAGGDAGLALDPLLPLALGPHVLTLEVSDAVSVSPASLTLTVVGSAPVAVPFRGGVFARGEPVTLTGAVADADGGTLAFEWLEGTRVLASGTVDAPAGGSPVNLPPEVVTHLRPGPHLLTLSVSDWTATTTATTTVFVTLPRHGPPERRRAAREGARGDDLPGDRR